MSGRSKIKQVAGNIVGYEFLAWLILFLAARKIRSNGNIVQGNGTEKEHAFREEDGHTQD